MQYINGTIYQNSPSNFDIKISVYASISNGSCSHKSVMWRWINPCYIVMYLLPPQKYQLIYMEMSFRTKSKRIKIVYTWARWNPKHLSSLEPDVKYEKSLPWGTCVSPSFAWKHVFVWKCLKLHLL